ncbi:MAG: hypothetical protein AAF799_33335 [Myxococcota bacterium]
MTELPPVAAFVHAFHDDLTAWFSGSGDRTEVWARLEAACRPLQGLVYPSGTRLTGPEFLDTIADRFASSPGFVAAIENLEVVHQASDHAVVAYHEVQAGARQSSTRNRRAALALVALTGEGCTWRFIQETALPD